MRHPAVAVQWCECETHRCGISVGGERPDQETVAHFSLPLTCLTPLQLYFIHRLPRGCHTASVASLPNKLVYTGRNVTHFSYKYILVNLGYFYVLMG